MLSSMKDSSKTRPKKQAPGGKRLKKVFLKSLNTDTTFLSLESRKRLKKNNLHLKKKRYARIKANSERGILPSQVNYNERVKQWLKDSKPQSEEKLFDVRGDSAPLNVEEINVFHQAVDSKKCSALNSSSERNYQHAVADQVPTSAAGSNMEVSSSIQTGSGHRVSVEENHRSSRAVDFQEENQSASNDILDNTSSNLDHVIPVISKAAALKKSSYKYFLKHSPNGRPLAFKKSWKMLPAEEIKKMKKKTILPLKWDVSAINETLSLSTGAGEKSSDVLEPDISSIENVPMQIIVKEMLVPSPMFPKSFPISSERVEPSLKFPSKMKIRGLDLELQDDPPDERRSQLMHSNQLEEVGSNHSANIHPLTAEPTPKPTNKQDVCYIFAILDKVHEETLLKCSPQIKTSRMLDEIYNVLSTISADDDIITSSRIHLSDNSLKCFKNVDYVLQDRSTSPAFPTNLVEKGTQVTNGVDTHDQSSVHSFLSQFAGSSNNDGCTGKVEERSDSKGGTLNVITKVLVSKAMLSFTSELTDLTELSLKVLTWSCGTVRGDIDSDACTDEFEGFLCLCHDKMSILMECLFFLDSKQILNVDEKELTRFWLLHDAICCMLQAYRYMQNKSQPSSLSHQLDSLMTTCAKMILPSAKTDFNLWISTMTRMSEICKKFLNAELMFDACQCCTHYTSLINNRSCRVCDVDRLHQEKCKAINSTDNQKADVSRYFTSKVVEQLFPRFHQFLKEMEKWSEQDFVSSLSKHTAVKFSCNVDCCLYPCDEHMSVIACSCFSQNMNESDPQPDNQGDTALETIPPFESHEKHYSALSDGGMETLKNGNGETILEQKSLNDFAPNLMPKKSCLIMGNGVQADALGDFNQLTTDGTGERMSFFSEKESEESKSLNDKNCQSVIGDLPLSTDNGSVASSGGGLSVSSQNFILELDALPSELEEGHGIHNQSRSDVHLAPIEEVEETSMKPEFGIGSYCSSEPLNSTVVLGSSSDSDIESDSSCLKFHQDPHIIGEKKKTIQNLQKQGNESLCEVRSEKSNDERVSLFSLPDDVVRLQNRSAHLECNSQELFEGVSTCAVNGSESEGSAESAYEMEDYNELDVIVLSDSPGPSDSLGGEIGGRSKPANSSLCHTDVDEGISKFDENHGNSDHTQLKGMSNIKMEIQSDCSFSSGVGEAKSHHDEKPSTEIQGCLESNQNSKKKSVSQEIFKGPQETAKSTIDEQSLKCEDHQSIILEPKTFYKQNSLLDQENNDDSHFNFNRTRTIVGTSGSLKKKTLLDCIQKGKNDLSKVSEESQHHSTNEKNVKAMGNEQSVCDLPDTFQRSGNSHFSNGESRRVLEVDVRPKKKVKNVTFSHDVQVEPETVGGVSKKNHLSLRSKRLTKQERKQENVREEVDELKIKKRKQNTCIVSSGDSHGIVEEETKSGEMNIERSKQKKKEAVKEKLYSGSSPIEEVNNKEPRKKRKTLRLVEEKKRNACEDGRSSDGDVGSKDNIVFEKVLEYKKFVSGGEGVSKAQDLQFVAEKEDEVNDGAKRKKKKKRERNTNANLDDEGISSKKHSKIVKPEDGIKLEKEKDSKLKKNKKSKKGDKKEVERVSKSHDKVSSTTDVKIESDSGSQNINDSYGDWNNYIGNLKSKLFDQ